MNETTITVKMSEQEIALEYATRIATAVWQKHWKAESPDWKPFDDMMGVLSQIDSMCSGMKRQEPCAGRCGEPDCCLDVEGAPLNQCVHELTHTTAGTECLKCGQTWRAEVTKQ